MKRLSRLLLLLIPLAFAGCEKQEYFKSESEIKKELGYSWKQVIVTKIDSSTESMVWEFSEDSIIISFVKTQSGAASSSNLILRGTYSVRTTLTKVFLTTSSFPEDPAWYWLNAEWTVVALDSRILVIASEDPRAGGINEREFVRID